MKPFKEIILSEKKIIRVFSNDIDNSELKWHFDLEDREIIPLNKNDWKIQFDNNLPIVIQNKIFIKKNQWHRIFAGNKKHLILLINKLS
jgi:hypothetical protein